MYRAMLASPREFCGCRSVPRADVNIRPYNDGKAVESPISSLLSPNFSKIVAQTTHKTLPIWYNILCQAKGVWHSKI